MTNSTNSKSITKLNTFLSIWSLVGNVILTIFSAIQLIQLIFHINSICSNGPSTSCGSSQFLGYLFSIFIILPLLAFLILVIYSIRLLCCHLDIRKIRRATSSIILLSSAFMLISFAILIQFVLSVGSANDASIITALTNGTRANTTPTIAAILVIGLYFLSLIILSIMYKQKLPKKTSS